MPRCPFLPSILHLLTSRTSALKLSGSISGNPSVPHLLISTLSPSHRRCSSWQLLYIFSDVVAAPEPAPTTSKPPAGSAITTSAFLGGSLKKIKNTTSTPTAITPGIGQIVCHRCAILPTG